MSNKRMSNKLLSVKDDGLVEISPYCAVLEGDDLFVVSLCYVVCGKVLVVPSVAVVVVVF